MRCPRRQRTRDCDENGLTHASESRKLADQAAQHNRVYLLVSCDSHRKKDANQPWQYCLHLPKPLCKLPPGRREWLSRAEKRRERMVDVVRTSSLRAQCDASVAGARIAAVLARQG